MSDLIQLGVTGSRPSPPKPEDLKLQFSDQAVAELEALLTHYPDKKSCILPGLWIAQREYGGYLSAPAIAEVAARLERSYAEVEGVATFYSMYNTKHEVGKHMIEVCTCLSCQLCGVYPLAEYLKKKLGVDFGETTPDGVFTLHEVECLNACDRAPLIQVGTEYHGPVDEAYVDNLLDRLRAQDASTVVQLADSIVQSQLADFEKPGASGAPRATTPAPAKSARIRVEESS
jgi:NADH-quinone oxidoreductase E subunit